VPFTCSVFWESGTGALEQTWSGKDGWEITTAFTWMCTSIVEKCVIDTKAIRTIIMDECEDLDLSLWPPEGRALAAAGGGCDLVPTAASVGIACETDLESEPTIQGIAPGVEGTLGDYCCATCSAARLGSERAVLYVTHGGDVFSYFVGLWLLEGYTSSE